MELLKQMEANRAKQGLVAVVASSRQAPEARYLKTPDSMIPIRNNPGNPAKIEKKKGNSRAEIIENKAKPKVVKAYFEELIEKNLYSSSDEE